MYPNALLFIDGAWTRAAAGRTLPVVSPASGDTNGTVTYAERTDLDRALEAADKGFREWRKAPAFDRSKVMRKAANLLRDRADAIAPLLTMEQGKPLLEAKGEVLAGADVIDWFTEEARQAYGRVIPARAEGIYQLVVKEPVGPVAAFTPWNFPINQVVRKLACALAAGCSIIVKGLASHAYSRSAKIENAIAAAIESGMISINHHDLALPEVPFGGVKDSGYGSEGGMEAIENYLNTKFISQAGL
jgi:succinate-semialdehyde dehydrogenase/glutarate-semialdehyde dehydrogenase